MSIGLAQAHIAAAPGALTFIWGAASIAFALHFAFGRFFADAFVRTRTIYALTDDRALIFSGLSGARLTTVRLADAVDVRFGSLAGGRGTIRFILTAGEENEAKEGPEFFRAEHADEAWRVIQGSREAVLGSCGEAAVAQR